MCFALWLRLGLWSPQLLDLELLLLKTLVQRQKEPVQIKLFTRDNDCEFASLRFPIVSLWYVCLCLRLAFATNKTNDPPKHIKYGMHFAIYIPNCPGRIFFVHHSRFVVFVMLLLLFCGCLRCWFWCLWFSLLYPNHLVASMAWCVRMLKHSLRYGCYC